MKKLTDEQIREEAKRRQQEDQKNLTWTFSPVSFIEGAIFASTPRFKEQEIRLLTAMVIEMKNEISQTVRHCQAQAIINKLKDEHTL